MVVPRCVINIHEANAAFDEPPREQAVSGKGSKLAGTATAVGFDFRIFAINSVGFESGPGFAAQIDQLRRGALHSESELVGRDSAGDFRIADLFVAKPIQVIDRIQPIMLHLAGDSRWIT